MKKALSFIILLFLAANCFSQNKLQTGLTIGYNSSSFLGKDTPGKKVNPLPGFYLGGIINYPLNDRLYLLTNVALTSKGTKINTMNEINEMVVFLNIDIPVMAGMKFLPGKKLTPYAELGGAFDINVMSFGTNGPYFDIRKIDFGLVAGAGIDAGKVSLGIRYFYGLTHFDKSELENDLRNSTISFLLGLTFGK
jgi:hypothetical protein